MANLQECTDLAPKARADGGMQVAHLGFDFMRPPQSSSRRIHALVFGLAKMCEFPNPS